MKKYILYILASIGGFFIGLLAGLFATIIVGLPFCMAFGLVNYNTPMIDHLNAIAPFCMKICAFIGAGLFPYLMRRKITEWPDG